MKTIVQLLATLNEQGESIIYRIRDKINNLINLPTITFQLGSSGSRDSSQGSIIDLRCETPLETQGDQAKEVREFLANLQQSNIMKFEEQQDFDTHLSRFIITHVDEHILLNAASSSLKVLNPVFSTSLLYETIRVGLHQIRVDYVTVKSAGWSDNLIQNMTLLSPAECDANTPDSIKPEQLQSIAHLLTEKTYLGHVINLVNECMGLQSVPGFQLYLQSSHSDYPIDLRVYLPLDHPEVANIRAKLTGFSLLGSKAIVFEEKMATSDVAIFIIKELRPLRLESYLKQLHRQINTPEELNEIVQLLKRSFPENALIQHLALYTGTSVTRPYPHIRCQHFYPERDVHQAVELLSAALGKSGDFWGIDKRPKTREESEERTGYKMFKASPRELQLIIDVKDFVRLQEKLNELVVVSHTPECFC